MPSAAVRRLSPLQWAGVGLGGCAVLLALLGLLAPASAFFFPLLSLWASVGLFVLALCVLRVAGAELDFLHKAVVFGIWAVAVVYFYWTLSSRSFVYVWDYANYLLKQYDAEAAFAQSAGAGLAYIFGSMADDYTNFITLFTEFPFCLTSHTGDAYSFSQVFCILPTLLVLLAGLVVKVGQILNVKNRMYYFLFGMTLTAAYPFLRMSAVLAQPDWFGLIFAFAILSFPDLIMNLFGLSTSNSSFYAWWSTYMGSGSYLYMVILCLFIVFFAYFYNQIQFNPDDISKSIQSNGGFIPGTRPGKPTADYLRRVSNRITLFGAIFLALLALIPSLIFKSIDASLVNVFSATGLLIIVSVALEFDQALQSQIMMKNYKGFLK